MILIINKWGNSQGLRFPKEFLNKINISVGMSVKAEYVDGKIIIEPVHTPKKFNIKELVKKIPKDYKPEEYDWGIKGKEEW